MYAGTSEKVCVVGGWWWVVVVVVCKPILVFSFGPDQALGLELGLGPRRTINLQSISKNAMIKSKHS